MQEIGIQLYDSPERAPRYTTETPLKIDSVAIIANGTVNGQPTLDLVMTDREGGRYVTLLTSVLLRGIYSICQQIDPDGDLRKVTVVEGP